MNKRLNLILNGKGGVGKSFFAVNLVQYLKDRDRQHIAFDTDNENSTLKRFHSSAQFIDISESRELDDIFAALAKVAVVIVDCRAASTELFLDYFTEIDVVEVCKRLGSQMTAIMPVNHEADSLDQIDRFAEQQGTRFSYVILKNEVHSDSFALYDRSATRKRLTNELGAREIIMTRLPSWLVEQLNRTNLTITQAKCHADFSLLDRQRLIMWQRRLYEQIDSVTDLLLPANSVKPHEEAERLL